MYDDKELDKLLYRAGKEHSDEFRQAGPDFSRIEAQALAAWRQRSRKRRAGLAVRVAVAAVSALVLINVFLLFTEFEPVKAYQEQMRKLVFNAFSSKSDDKVEAQYYKAATEIAKVQKLVPFHILVPSALPAGYSFQDVQMRDDGNHVYDVKIKYASGDKILSVDASNNGSVSGTAPSTSENGFEKIDLDGMEVYLKATDGPDIESKCIFFSKQGLIVYVSGPLDKQSLLAFVKSLA